MLTLKGKGDQAEETVRKAIDRSILPLGGGISKQTPQAEGAVRPEKEADACSLNSIEVY